MKLINRILYITDEKKKDEVLKSHLEKQCKYLTECDIGSKSVFEKINNYENDIIIIDAVSYDINYSDLINDALIKIDSILCYCLVRLKTDVIDLSKCINKGERIYLYREKDDFHNFINLFRSVIDSVKMRGKQSDIDTYGFTNGSSPVTKEQLLSVLESIPSGIAVISKDYKIVKHNKKQREWFPKAKEGDFCYDGYYNPGNERHCQSCPTMFVFRTGKVDSSIQLSQSPEGSDRYFEVVSSPIYNADGEIEFVVENAIDITSRVEQQFKIAEQNERLEDHILQLKRINNLQAKIIASTSIDKLSQVIVDEAVNLMEANAGSIAFLTEDRKYLHYVYNYNFPIFNKLEPIDRSVAGYVIRNNKPIIYDEYGEHEYAIKEYVENGLKSVLAFPLTGGGSPIGVLGIFGLHEDKKFYDTDIKKLEGFHNVMAIAIQKLQLIKSLKKETKRAIAATKSKNKYLASISHEIKTPLNSIIGFSDLLLLKKNLLEDKRERIKYIKNINDSGKHLLSLIEDILNISKIEENKHDVKITDFVVEDVINDIIFTLKGQADKRNISIETDYDKLIYTISTDEKLFKQILYNLVSNAVKYNVHGGKVFVSYRETKDVDNIEIVVKDTGIGIIDSDKWKIFNEFQTIEDERITGKEQTGLGLYLTKKIVNLLGGTISFTSEYEKGTMFMVVLPKEFYDKEKKEHKVDGVERYKENLPDLSYDIKVERDFKVFIIDDDWKNLELCSALLSAYSSIKLFTFSSSRDALEKAKIEKPDILLTDIDMPFMDGITLINQLKEEPETKNIYVVAFSAMLLESDTKDKILNEFDEIIEKPFEVKYFAERIKKILLTIATQNLSE